MTNSNNLVFVIAQCASQMRSLQSRRSGDKSRLALDSERHEVLYYSCTVMSWMSSRAQTVSVIPSRHVRVAHVQK